MRKNIEHMAQRETGRNLRDDGSRLSKLETQEFSAATAISALVSNGTWTPTVTGSVSNPTITYTNQFGRYTVLFGLLVFYSLRVDVNTFSGGSGDLRVSLPFTCSNVNSADLVRGAANFNGVDVGAGSYGLHFRPTTGQSYGSWQYSVDNATSVLTAIADVAAGDALIASGWYWK